MSSHAKELEVKRKIRKTWPEFLAQFGRLTEVQTAAIPKILMGKSTIVVSATASGKTEAVISPIVEQMIDHNSKGKLATIYVSPTRALVNDMYERLATKLKDLDFELGVWTGDRRSFEPSNPQDFLLLTPESLDSAISRTPESFDAVEFCILDELHLVDGTARGDQLAILCRRMQDLSKHTIQFCALSATLRESAETRFPYFEPEDIVRVKGSREIRYELFPAGDDALRIILSRFREKGLKKALLFCNSRKGAETLAQELKRELPAENVVVHHGSLPRDLRESAEESLREAPSLFCACTSTLEVGIDIGDVDVVVLNGCPPTVSSLLQRMGRGNRRRDYVMAFGLYESDDERRAFENLFTKAIGGELEDVPHSPCISVALQQTFSVLFQNRRSGIDLQHLKTLLGLFEMSDAQWNELIAHLEAEDYLEESRGKLFPSQKLLDLADKGRIHSNISSAAAFNVVSNNTGETLGEIGYLDAHSVFLLVGGKYSRVVRVQERTVYVEPVANATVANTNFPRRRNRGEFYWMLPQTLRAISEC